MVGFSKHYLENKVMEVSNAVNEELLFTWESVIGETNSGWPCKREGRGDFPHGTGRWGNLEDDKERESRRLASQGVSPNLEQVAEEMDDHRDLPVKLVRFPQPSLIPG